MIYYRAINSWTGARLNGSTTSLLLHRQKRQPSVPREATSDVFILEKVKCQSDHPPAPRIYTMKRGIGNIIVIMKMTLESALQ